MERVNESNIGEFASILQEAARWMISKGLENWNPLNLTTEKIRENNSIDELFICYKNGKAAGCLKLQDTDEMFWPDAVYGEALYVHKLAVKRKYSGMGISKYMLDWAKEQARFRGRKYLRLDCIANREKLCNLYRDYGFERVDEKQVLGNWISARFELRV